MDINNLLYVHCMGEACIFMTLNQTAHIVPYGFFYDTLCTKDYITSSDRLA